MVLLDQDRHYLQRLERYCIKNGITEVTPEACLGCVSEVAEIKIDAFATTGSVQIDSYLRTYKMYLSYLKSGKANCALLTRARPTEITAPYAREFLSAFRTSGQRCYRFARCFHAMLRLSSFCRTKSIETVTEQTCLDCVSDLLGYRLDAFRRWWRSGVDVTNALPYLSAFMGHTSCVGTEYYIHLTSDLFPDIVAKMNESYGDLIVNERN